MVKPTKAKFAKVIIFLNVICLIASQNQLNSVKAIALKDNLNASCYLTDYMAKGAYEDTRLILDSPQSGFDFSENYETGVQYSIDLPKTAGSYMETLEFYFDSVKKGNSPLQVKKNYGYNMTYSEELITTYKKPLSFYSEDNINDYNFEFNFRQPQLNASFKSDFLPEMADVLSFNNILIGLAKTTNKLAFFEFEQEKLKRLNTSRMIIYSGDNLLLEDIEFTKIISESNLEDSLKYIMLLGTNGKAYILKVTHVSLNIQLGLPKVVLSLVLTYTERRSSESNPVVDFVEKKGIFYIAHKTSIVIRNVRTELNEFFLNFQNEENNTLSIQDIHGVGNAIYVLLKDHGVKILNVEDPESIFWVVDEIVHPNVQKISSYWLPYYDFPFLVMLVNNKGGKEGNEFFVELSLENPLNPLVFRYYLSEKVLNINYIISDNDYTYLFEHNSNSFYAFSRSVTATSRNSVYKMHIEEIANRDVMSPPFIIKDETYVHSHLGIVAENKFIFTEKVEYTKARLDITFRSEGQYEMAFHTFTDFCNLSQKEVQMCRVALNFKFLVSGVKVSNVTILLVFLLVSFIALVVILILKFDKFKKWLKTTRYVQFHSNGNDTSYNTYSTEQGDKDSNAKTIALTPLQKTRPVIVDFHASWCGPCKQLAPSLEAAAKEGKFTLIKIDIDTYGQDAEDNEVSSIPYVVLYIDGEKKSDFLGFDTSALQTHAHYEGNFQKEVIEASKTKPVIVDFYADWCGPCKQLAPSLEEAAKGGKFTLIKIDIDNFNDDADSNGVSSIPHVMLFKNGEKVKEFLGCNVPEMKAMVALCN